jgi:hypothetical protein
MNAQFVVMFNGGGSAQFVPLWGTGSITYTIHQTLSSNVSQLIESIEDCKHEVSTLIVINEDYIASISVESIVNQDCESSISEYSESVITINHDLLAKVSSDYTEVYDARARILDIDGSVMFNIELPSMGTTSVTLDSNGISYISLESTCSLTTTNIGG